MKILICGFGNIGHHVEQELLDLVDNKKENAEIFIYDTKLEKTKENIKLHYDFAFICVPTDNNKDGVCDTSIVFSVVDRVDADIIIIKSAVPVGT